MPAQLRPAVSAIHAFHPGPARGQPRCRGRCKSPKDGHNGEDGEDCHGRGSATTAGRRLAPATYYVIVLVIVSVPSSYSRLSFSSD